MSRLELVLPVAAKSRKQVQSCARGVLQEFAPDRLQRPGPLDYQRLIDEYLPQQKKIDVYPVTAEEMELSEGLTRVNYDAPTRIQILVPFNTYDALFEDRRETNRARSTLAHEIGHAIQHGRFLRRMRNDKEAVPLHRQRGHLQAFEDPEWQAWTFAGELLLPMGVLRQLHGCSITEVAVTFGVSEPMVEQTIYRLRTLGYRSQGGVLTVQ